MDFSIIKIVNWDVNSTNSIIYEFNPFYNRLNYKYLRGNTNIFSEKLDNVNGYPMRLAKIANYYKSILVERKGKIIAKSDIAELRIDFILRIMNFSMIKKLGNITSFLDMYEWNTNMLSFGVLGLRNRSNLLIPMNDEAIKVSAFVPILPAGKVTKVSTLFYNLFIIFVVVLILFFTSKFLRIFKDSLRVYSLLTIILGQSIVKAPQKIASRIIYLILVASYVKLMCFDLYSNIVEVKFESGEVSFDSYEDLYRSKFTVYTMDPRTAAKISNDRHLKNMMKRLIVIDDISKCFDKLVESKNVICLGAEHIIYQFGFINEKFEHPVFKKAKIPLWTELIVFYEFEDASPYAEKFQKILRTVQETSLDWMESLKSGYKNKYYIEDEPEKKFDDKIDTSQLILVLLCGYFLATPTFIAELVTFKYTRTQY